VRSTLKSDSKLAFRNNSGKTDSFFFGGEVDEFTLLDIEETQLEFKTDEVIEIN
jgi:hypothetical protein